MKQTFKLGTLFGIPVGMHWSVLVIMALIADLLARSVLPQADPAAAASTRWAVGVAAAAVFLASLAAHEFAHALVARWHGVRVESVTLWMLGGVAVLADEPPDARADLRIAGVGPAASAAAAVLFGAAAAGGVELGVPHIITASLAWLAASNALIAVFNLLPGAPLDGGRILRAILWRRGGDRASADHAAARAGTALGRVMIGGGLLVMLLVNWFNGLWLAVVGWFIAGSARSEDRWTDLHEAAEGMTVADVMTPYPDHGWAWQPAGAFVEGVALRSRQSAFPVLDVTGEPVGAVTVDGLGRVPSEHADIPLRDISVPLPPDRVVAPEAPMITLLQLAPVAADLIAVVTADHRLVGIVTTADIEGMLRRGRLRHGDPAAV
ncbi:site-2 protease family protein [Actinomadura chibensis]|uniref:Zinc metalloprotease n=1 Tax=Actinomadura chibensis TaxID=392828 RepID=A0A5D0NHS8_9ACTN|nr:site-2 protease family protein [Actinomadura chibensis]TYB43923.1 site-2 protease family protein [Actinomadura chibensis]